jgi:cytochrome c oxidase subunit 3
MLRRFIMEKYEHYYVPDQSQWPLVGSIGLGTFVTGIVGLFHQSSYGVFLFLTGAIIITYMLFGWFGNVIHESQKGLYSKQMDISFRWGMIWFIFSEVMFFGAFFGALFLL